MKVPPDFWPQIDLTEDDTPDFAATALECALVFAVCLLVAGTTGLLAGLMWGWLA